MVEYGEGEKTSHRNQSSLSFSEIVGQTELKQALRTIAVNDDLDGLLIQGEKGTAKSTSVRALTDLLPSQRVVDDCPYGCPPQTPEQQCLACRDRTDPPTTERSVPLVTLPLGATRDRVTGTLSVADALDGDYEFDPGLLARANRGILYVDEVNLLDDHLVDILLDAAASGVNTVERDGVSVTHPAEFTLIGTMNPEEGDLRPQLRDRFALQATVKGCDDIDQRVEIIDRVVGDSDAQTGTHGGVRRRTLDLRERLLEARQRISEVDLPPDFTREIAELCRDAGIDGHRGDIATARAARTFAALEERTSVIESDVRRAANLALPHRLKTQPFEEAPDPSELLDDHFDDTSDGEPSEGDQEETTDTDSESDETDPTTEEERSADDHGTDASGSRQSGENSTKNGTDSASAPDSGEGGAEPDAESAEPIGDEAGSETGGDQAGTPIVPGERRVDVGNGTAPEMTPPDAIEQGREMGGERVRTQPQVDGDGARVRDEPARSVTRIDAAASVRAATARGATSIESRDLRQSVRRTDASALVLFVVDASASMHAAMESAKGTVLELLKDAYEHRDEVAFVAFTGDDAEVLLPPTDSVTLASRHLKDLPVGDRTPLPAGLRTASDVLDEADPASSVVVLVTDGRANVADESPVHETREAAERLAEHNTQVVTVDAGSNGGEGLIDEIVEATGGTKVALSALSAERVDTAVAETTRGANR